MSFDTMLKKTGYVFVAVLFFAACIFTINNITTVLTWHVAIPFSDEWDVFPRMIALQEAGFPIKDVLGFLWEQHSEHRIVIPKAIYLIDMMCFSYKGYFPLVCIVLFQVMAAGMLAWLVVKKDRGLWAILLFVSFTIFAFFNLIQNENFLSTFQTSFVGCFAFAVAALVTYAKYVVSQRKYYFFCTLLFATVTSLSLASGLFVWLVLAVSAYLTHEKRYTQPLIFMGMFIAFLSLYLHGYKSPVGHANPIESLSHHPLLVLEYFTVWLGNVAGTVSSAKLLGSTGLVTLLSIVAYLFKDKNRRTRHELYALLGICLFVLIAGFVTALGRVNFGSGQAMAGRYATPVLLFWVSLLGIMFLLALDSRHAQIIRSSAALILLAVVGLLMSNYRGEKSMIEFQNQQTRAYIAVLTAGYVEQPQLLLPVYPLPGLILSKIDLLKSHNLSSFSATDASALKIGGVFAPLIMQNSSDCKGHVDGVTAIGKDTFEVTGWAWSEAKSSYPDWIVFVQNGKVIGLGKPGVKRPDVLAAIPSIKKMRVGWLGIASASGEVRPRNIEAFISTKSGSYCRI